MFWSQQNRCHVGILEAWWFFGYILKAVVSLGEEEFLQIPICHLNVVVCAQSSAYCWQDQRCCLLYNTYNTISIYCTRTFVHLSALSKLFLLFQWRYQTKGCGQTKLASGQVLRKQIWSMGSFKKKRRLPKTLC